MIEQDAVDPTRQDKLLSGHMTKIRIAGVSALVLVIGAWLTPPAAQRTLSAPQELAAPLLEEQVQQREAGRTFVGVQDIAASVTAHSAAIASPASPAALGVRNDFEERQRAAPIAGFGVFVSATHLLTHSMALAGRSSVPLSTADGRTGIGEVVAYEPTSGLVLLRTASIGTPPTAMATTAPAAGALTVAAVRSDRDIAVPVFVTAVGADSYTLGAVSGSLLPGMPVYTLAGELLAIAASDGSEVRAFPATQASERLLARAATGERRSSLGLAFQAVAGRLTDAFGDRGVVVTDIVPGGPADLADIQAGDVLLSADDVDLDSTDTATRTLSSRTVGTATRLRVLRNGRTRDVDVTPALAYEVAALARGNVTANPGLEARTVLSAAALESAAIPLTARMLSVAGRPVTSRAQAQRELRRARGPVPVLLRHDDTQYFAVLEPQP